MKNILAFTAAAATLGLALSAHAVQATGTNIGLVIKPTTTPVVAVIKPTQTAPIQTNGSGPKVRPMSSVRNAPPVKH
jgi:hypothetical protein